MIDVATIPAGELRPLRRQMQMIFQDPFSSLNPRMTLLDIVGEPLLVNGVAQPRRSATDRVAELLRLVGLRPEYMRRYPHAFSGGQRQRIGIARALALNPQARRRRRAGLGARRLGAGADPQPAARPAGAARPHLPVRRPRPERRRAHQRPGGGDVRRQDRRDGADRGALRVADAPLHRGAALGGAQAGSAAARRADRPGGRGGRPGQPAAGLLLPPALPLRAGHLPARRRRCRKRSPPSTS